MARPKYQSSRRKFLRVGALGSLVVPALSGARALALPEPGSVKVPPFELEEASIADLQAGLASGKFTAQARRGLRGETFGVLRSWLEAHRSIVALAIVLTCVASSAAPAAEAPLTPTEIYVKMRAAVNALPVPPYIAFTEQDEGEQNARAFVDRIRIVTRVSDAHAWVHPLLDERGDPSQLAPRVVTTIVYPGTIIERVGEFPLADFGLRPRRAGRPGLFEAPGTPEPAPSPPSGLQAIGSVSTYNLSYRITNLGDTAIGSAPVHHLGLSPIRDPGHNVLREIWIDASTYLPRRYVAERFVENGGLSFRYLITVNTALIQGHLVNVDAAGHFEVHRALVIHYSGDGRWTISDVTFPVNPPAWLFDPDHYGEHQNDPLPAL